MVLMDNKMKTFKTFKILTEDHKVENMSDTQILRKAMVGELDTLIDYECMAKYAINPQVKKLLLDVAYEEKVHAEEFETLLEELDDEYTKAEEQAEEEVEYLLGDEDEDEYDEDEYDEDFEDEDLLGDDE